MPNQPKPLVPDPTSTVVRIALAGEAETRALAEWFAQRLGAGDCLLLEGPIGAGKTFFARAIIQSLLARDGRSEDVPSPTFTLVQAYETRDFEIWHADLYRLGTEADLLELGLDEALDAALCLIEWPDRMGTLAPPDALWIRLRTDPDPAIRHAEIFGAGARWPAVLAELRWHRNG